MLLSFTVENFKSFKERATLSLVARRTEKTLKGALLSVGDGARSTEQVLPALAIYGANASGKSNLLLAFSYMRRAICRSQTEWKSGTGTRFDPNAFLLNEDGFFEAIICIENVKYRYGFKVNKTLFTEEWLYSYPKGRERLLFRRLDRQESEEVSDNYLTSSQEFSSKIEFGAHLNGDRREHDSSFRRTRENSLFVSSAAQDNQLECKKVEEWFRLGNIHQINLNVVNSNQGLTSYLANEHKNFKSLLLPLLRAADPCIQDIIVEPPVGNEVVDDIEANQPRFIDYKVSFIISRDGKSVKIPFANQSRGVKRLYALAAGLITGLKFGKLILIDELETSLHAHVASQLLALFQNISSNPYGAQLIFTTHETRLLNLQHLRRDQVWFCERSLSGETSLFSLLEFSPRKDENFEMGYLRGRYGAVPMAGVDPSWLQAINDENLDMPYEG